MTTFIIRLLRTSVFISLIVNSLFGQRYHSPAEIVKILCQSDINYEISFIQNSSPDRDKNALLNLHGVFWYDANYNHRLTTYKEEYQKNSRFINQLKEADQDFSDGKLKTAREKYLKILDIIPNCAQVKTYIGQTLHEEKKYEEAEKWYKQAIESNYYDFMAHWFLSALYNKRNDKENAINEITIANILNRNHPKIQNTLHQIFKESDKIYSDWSFNPVYLISSPKKDYVRIQYSVDHPEWLMYSICKALWNYEPDYSNKILQKSNGDIPAIIEEKDCLFTLLAGEKNKYGQFTSGNKSIKKVIDATNKEMINDFIMYEIILTQSPEYVFNLDKKGIEQLVKYVIEFHT